MRQSILAISAGVMMLAPSGEVEAQSTPSDVIQMYQQYANSSDAAKAAKIAALYTPGAVALFSEGKFVGPSQIEQDLQAQFDAGWKNVTIKDEGGDTTQGSWAWSWGEYSGTVPVGTPPKPTTINGYWSAVFKQDGNVWKINQHTTNMEQSLSNRSR
jgi:ketosteroid isomerase-like protein